jgi:hypothetical protein
MCATGSSGGPPIAAWEVFEVESGLDRRAIEQHAMGAQMEIRTVRGSSRPPHSIAFINSSRKAGDRFRTSAGSVSSCAITDWSLDRFRRHGTSSTSGRAEILDGRGRACEHRGRSEQLERRDRLRT